MTSLLYQTDGTDTDAGFGGFGGFGFAFGCESPVGTWTRYDIPYGRQNGINSAGIGDFRTSQYLNSFRTARNTFTGDDGPFDADTSSLSINHIYANQNNGNLMSAVAACSDVAVGGSAAANPISLLIAGDRCQVGTGQITIEGTGDLSVTAIGFEDLGDGQQPDAVILLGADPRGFQDPGATNAVFSLGAFDKDGNQWAVGMAGYAETGPTGEGGYCNAIRRASTFNNGLCINFPETPACALGTGSPLPDMGTVATFVSMDTDGFTINISSTSGGVITWMAVKVDPGQGGIAVGSLTEGDGGVTGLAFQPDSVIMAGNGDPAGNSVSASPWTTGTVGVGGADSTLTQRSSFGGAASDPPDDAGSSYSIGSCYYGNSVIAFGDPSTETIEAEATLSSWNADGFSLDWTTTTGSRGIGYIAFQVNEFDLTSVTTAAATSVTGSSATLNGTITPNTTGTTVGGGDNVWHPYVQWQFEWGTTTGYGNTTTLTTQQGTTPTAVSAAISGLTTGVVYHYRLVGFRVESGYLTCEYDGADMTLSSSNAPVFNNHIRITE